MDLPHPVLSCDLDLPDAETIAYQWYVDHPHVQRPRRVICAEDGHIYYLGARVGHFEEENMATPHWARALALIAFVALVVYWII